MREFNKIVIIKCIGANLKWFDHSKLQGAGIGKLDALGPHKKEVVFSSLTTIFKGEANIMVALPVRITSLIHVHPINYTVGIISIREFLKVVDK